MVKKRYLITGGAGFIGANLTENLCSRSNQCLVIDDLSSGYQHNLKANNSIEFIEDKVQNISIDELGHIDGIFHLAAQASVPYSINNFYNSSKNNLLSSIKVLDWAKDLKVPIVYASSSAIYGNMDFGDEDQNSFNILSPYAQDKLVLEEYASLLYQNYNVSSLGLRFFNVYGPKQDALNPYSGVISIFIDRILKNQPVIVNGGFQTRDFIFVSDVVEVLKSSMEYLNNNQICDYLNVGTGKSISVNQLLGVIKKILTADPEIILKELKKGDPEKSSGNYRKIKEILGFDISKFKNIEFGLKETIKYFKNSYE